MCVSVVGRPWIICCCTPWLRLICSVLFLNLLGTSGCCREQLLMSCLVGGTSWVNILGCLELSCFMFDVDGVAVMQALYV